MWWAVIAAGVYHGVNPAMGWPMAVSSALMQRRSLALLQALTALAAGHFLAMALILLPFSALDALLRHATAIRVLAGSAVLLTGLYLLITRRHPRFLARVPPSRLVWWSFLAATAHGAALMVVPMMLGMERSGLTAQLSGAVLIAIVHTMAMALTGGLLAAGVYYLLGLRFLTASWINLDLVWAASLVVVGVFAIWSTLVMD